MFYGKNGATVHTLKRKHTHIHRDAQHCYPPPLPRFKACQSKFTTLGGTILLVTK